MKKIGIIFFSIVFINTNAQQNKQSAFAFNYNYQIPIGDLANTFGNNSSIGATYLLETNKNVIFGVEAGYLFGNNIKDSTIFENIKTADGAIIASNGNYANVTLMQSGFDAYLFAGYAFHFSQENLSGIYITQGFGYLQHQILINTKNQDIPQLNEQMKKGYDRFSNGYSTKFSVDYKYYHKNGRLQISSGLNYTMAYTKNLRAYNFARNEYYSNKRTWDQLLGINIELIIPIDRKNEEKFHYY
tara:strand:- start:638 stop:1369 length:732 start_codon:yes stop_codon:yes gene_type:complete